MLNCSSQRVQVKELQLVCLSKSLWLLSCSSQRAGEGASAGVFG